MPKVTEEHLLAEIERLKEQVLELKQEKEPEFKKGDLVWAWDSHVSSANAALLQYVRKSGGGRYECNDLRGMLSGGDTLWNHCELATEFMRPTWETVVDARIPDGVDGRDMVVVRREWGKGCWELEVLRADFVCWGDNKTHFMRLTDVPEGDD